MSADQEKPTDSATPEAEGPPEALPEGRSNEREGEGAKSFRVDLSEGVEKAFERLKERLARLVKKGQHTKVRLKFRGRELATLPIPVLLAAEAATFLGGGGLLRFLVVNALGRTFLDVEVLNDADAVVQAGRQRLLDGELDDALAKFREAISMDPGHAAAQLNLGIALKLKGAREEAAKAFEEAARLDPEGETGKEARRQLDAMKSRGT